MFKKLRQLDYWIAVPFGILSALGVVMVFSASLTNSAMLNFCYYWLDWCVYIISS